MARSRSPSEGDSPDTVRDHRNSGAERQSFKVSTVLPHIQGCISRVTGTSYTAEGHY